MILYGEIAIFGLMTTEIDNNLASQPAQHHLAKLVHQNTLLYHPPSTPSRLNRLQQSQERYHRAIAVLADLRCPDQTIQTSLEAISYQDVLHWRKTSRQMPVIILSQLLRSYPLYFRAAEVNRFAYPLRQAGLPLAINPIYRNRQNHPDGSPPTACCYFIAAIHQERAKRLLTQILAERVDLQVYTQPTLTKLCGPEVDLPKPSALVGRQGYSPLLSLLKQYGLDLNSDRDQVFFDKPADRLPVTFEEFFQDCPAPVFRYQTRRQQKQPAIIDLYPTKQQAELENYIQDRQAQLAATFV